jgi:hypothetical protein
MDWLREQMRDHVRNPAAIDSPENILSFPHSAPRPARYDATAALDLVSQAAATVRSIQDRASESEACARSG